MWSVCKKKVLLAFMIVILPISQLPILEMGQVFLHMVNTDDRIVDRLYLSQQDDSVVDKIKQALPQAQAAYDSSELEYQVDIGPINGNTTANYVFASLFNPSGSGKTLVVKRIRTKTDAVAAANNYVNLALRRTTAASAGTQITATNIPRKNNSSANPVAEVRHTGVTATFAGVTASRLMGQPMAGTTNAWYSVRDITFGTNDEYLILQPGEGVALYQEAAGNANHRVRATFEWEEVVSAPSAQSEYMIAIQRVENVAAANYVYNSFMNPSGSGKTAVVKRIWFGSETCDTTAVYTNNIVLRRISAASAGTQITAANIPKKHTGSGNSVMDVRHTGVTVTMTGGTDARLGHVTPCGAAAQATGWQEMDFYSGDEQLILQPGEGIALMSDAAGDVDQLTRMFVEWEEVTSTPTADNHYLWASSRVENVAAANGTTMYTYFNPSGSGKTMLVKRLGMRVNADTTATYVVLNAQRITAASGGTLIAAADLPKKHTGSSNSAMQVRWCGATCASAITTTYSGARSTAAAGLSDSGIFKTITPGVAGQPIGQREIVFSDNEPFVLKEGEGIGIYVNYNAGDLDHYTKAFLEWEEVASAPTTQNQYMLDIGPVVGNTGATYTYGSLFNPSASGKSLLVKRVGLRVNAVAAATYIPAQVRRITAASAGTQITAANIPKKNTSSSNSIAEVRRTNPTVTYAQGTDAQILGVTTPGAASAATTPATTGYKDLLFTDDEDIILKPGEGIALQHTAAADADHRFLLLLEWEEIDVASTPTAQENHILSLPPVNGSTAANYVYGSFLNPSTSGKTYILQRLGVRADRIGAITAPGYVPVTLRRISAASAGTVVSTADIPKKHASSTTSSAEIRTTNPTVTFSQATESRLWGVAAPGLVNSVIGIGETDVLANDEIVLAPGEGVALYQESTAGDTNMRYRFSFAWKEVDAPFVPSLTFSISDTAVGFGTLQSVSARYATGDGVGSGSDAANAHTVSVSTNAPSGYTVSLDGSTLTCVGCGGATISAIGATAVSSSVGTEQFGLRGTVVSGTGSVSTPYNSANWALDTGSFPDSFATGAGDEVTTVFGLRYLANVATVSEAGIYNAGLTFVVTASF